MLLYNTHTHAVEEDKLWTQSAARDARPNTSHARTTATAGTELSQWIR